MITKTTNNRIILYLLLCSLFLSSFIIILNTGGVTSSDMFDISPLCGRSEHSSVNGGANTGLFDYLAAANTSMESFIFSVKQLRWLAAQNSLSTLIAIVIIQIACFIHYSRLSDQAYTQSYFSVVLSFLHKTDGMK
ncbi:hypothetical protein [Dehalobacterium formicoaceticum]|uniref:Uncharacterized protein n=1 Tax=Dehalobacterium formicoaceticum TaxID=51515 RepID=A0ABT1Y1W1_9FIRM|nr:hypothetical protein [Dehalobacterium formicoaceticum]MCR6544849.1 hypothetical protein [Dehalobacterium formicoaceticum]